MCASSHNTLGPDDGIRYLRELYSELAKFLGERLETGSAEYRGGEFNIRIRNGGVLRRIRLPDSLFWRDGSIILGLGRREIEIPECTPHEGAFFVIGALSARGR